MPTGGFDARFVGDSYWSWGFGRWIGLVRGRWYGRGGRGFTSSVPFAEGRKEGRWGIYKGGRHPGVLTFSLVLSFSILLQSRKVLS